MTALSPGARAHVDALTRAWLGLGPDREVPHLPDDLARRLLRSEEYEHSYRDQWGNWEFGLCAAFRAGRLWEPDIDRWLLDRRRELGGAIAPLWPEGRPFAVCVSHDVDLIAEAVTPRQALRSMRLSLLGAGPSRRERMTRLARPGVRAARALAHGLSQAPAAEALERCVELERDRGVTASYFFTVYPGAAGHRYDCTYALGDRCRFGGARVTVADVARQLDREGFEVGLHGSYNSAFAEDRLTAEKDELEQATGLTVASIRQHFLHWDARVTPHLHSRAGFSADSTLGFNRNIGFRAGTSLPFRWFDVGRDSAVDVVELPMLVGDVALLRSDALELGPELAEETLVGRLDDIAEVGGVATLNFHPNSVENPDYLALFRRAIDYGTERGAWFASVRDLDAWFRARAA
jgi:peptidoglycan/xylan/chitin deacetylase (PgdA/CDA1 family)